MGEHHCMVGSYARVSIFIIAKINVKAESTRANNSTHGLYPVERSCFDTDGDLLNQLAVRSGRNISKSGKGGNDVEPSICEPCARSVELDRRPTSCRLLPVFTRGSQYRRITIARVNNRKACKSKPLAF